MKTADSGFCGEDTVCFKLWRVFIVENLVTADISLLKYHLYGFSFLHISKQLSFCLAKLHFFQWLKNTMLIKTCI